MNWNNTIDILIKIGAGGGGIYLLHFLWQRLYGMRSLFYRWKDSSWPIRVSILSDVKALYMYPDRRCHIEVICEFHPRISPVVLKSIYLEIIDGKNITSNSFDIKNDYDVIWYAVKRKEEFITDELVGDTQGKIIVMANDDKCKSNMFSIKLINQKLQPVEAHKHEQFEIDN